MREQKCKTKRVQQGGGVGSDEQVPGQGEFDQVLEEGLVRELNLN